MSSKDEPSLPGKPADEAPNPAHDEAQDEPEPPFTRDISVSLVAEFRRLAILAGWKRKTKRYRKKRVAYFRLWAAEDFAREFGKNDRSLRSWQKLCRLLDVGGGRTLGSTSECLKAISGISVNIIDLVDACKPEGEKPKTFKERKELSEYIRKTGKIFPIEHARRNRLLENFLIHVGGHNKGSGGGGGGGGGGGRGEGGGGRGGRGRGGRRGGRRVGAGAGEGRKKHPAIAKAKAALKAKAVEEKVAAEPKEAAAEADAKGKDA
ncbi:hypothetical protein VTO73DRAFT_14156 [Trametes versicolor]